MMGERLIKSTSTNTSTISNNNSCGSTNNNTRTSTIPNIFNNNKDSSSKMTTAIVAQINPKPAENGPSVHEPQQQQTSLKCPRCDSSNTKFCYYNNYSLSQPRHFCKACKRYWTRGGTLRNVPVGGGCRKNKRVKKPTPSSVSSASAVAAVSAIGNHELNNMQNLLPTNHLSISTSSHIDASMLYALHNSSDINLHIPHCTTAFDLNPQLSALGLGFAGHRSENDYHHLNQLQQLPLLSDYSASLLASTLKPHKKIDDYHPLFPYDDLQNTTGFNSDAIGIAKEIKSESQHDHAFADEWQFPQHSSTTATTFNVSTSASTVIPSDHTSSYNYWNSSIGNGWPDTANCGSSIAPLL